MAERTKAFYKNKLRICGEKLIQAETEYDTYLNQTDATISQQLGVANEYEVELMIARLQGGLSEMEKTVKQKQDSIYAKRMLEFSHSTVSTLQSSNKPNFPLAKRNSSLTIPTPSSSIDSPVSSITPPGIPDYASNQAHVQALSNSCGDAGVRMRAVGLGEDCSVQHAIAVAGSFETKAQNSVSFLQHDPKSNTPVKGQDPPIGATHIEGVICLNPKNSIGELERLNLCAVIVNHQERGWLELRCGICCGNVQNGDPPIFIKGISGMMRHVIHKHNNKDIGNPGVFVLEHCIHRQLSAMDVSSISNALTNGGEPIPRIVCSSADNRVSQSASIQKHANNSVKKAPNFANGGGDLGHTFLDKMVQDDNSDSDDPSVTTITFYETVPILCHHPVRGSFELQCHFCKGNAMENLGLLEWIRGPEKMYEHIKRNHFIEYRQMVEVGQMVFSLFNFYQISLSHIVSPTGFRRKR